MVFEESRFQSHFAVETDHVQKLLQISPDGSEQLIFIAHRGWTSLDDSSVPLITVEGWVGGRIGSTSCMYAGKPLTMMFAEDALVNGRTNEPNTTATRLRLDWTTSLARHNIRNFDKRMNTDPEIARMVEEDRQLNQMNGTVLVELDTETWTRIAVRQNSLAEVRGAIASLGLFEERFAFDNVRGFLVVRSHSVEVYTRDQDVQSALTLAFGVNQ